MLFGLPPQPEATGNKPAGIGGWLVLPAIWLTVGSVLAPIFLLNQWAETRYGWDSHLASTLRAFVVFGFFLWLLLVVAAIAFWKKSPRAPMLVISFLVLSFLAFGLREAALEFHGGYVARILFVFLWTGLWAAYFLWSKRVRNTFGVVATHRILAMSLENAIVSRSSPDRKGDIRTVKCLLCGTENSFTKEMVSRTATCLECKATLRVPERAAPASKNVLGASAPGTSAGAPSAGQEQSAAFCAVCQRNPARHKQPDGGPPVCELCFKAKYGPVGLGGWLSFPCLWYSLGFVGLAFWGFMFFAHAMPSEPWWWLVLGILVVESAIFVSAAWAFWWESRLAPTLITLSLVVGGLGSFFEGPVKGIAGTALAAIWIAYFARSRRVRNTFGNNGFIAAWCRRIHEFMVERETVTTDTSSAAKPLDIKEVSRTSEAVSTTAEGPLLRSEPVVHESRGAQSTTRSVPGDPIEEAGRFLEEEMAKEHSQAASGGQSPQSKTRVESPRPWGEEAGRFLKKAADSWSKATMLRGRPHLVPSAIAALMLLVTTGSSLLEYLRVQRALETAYKASALGDYLSSAGWLRRKPEFPTPRISTEAIEKAVQGMIAEGVTEELAVARLALYLTRAKRQDELPEREERLREAFRRAAVAAPGGGTGFSWPCPRPSSWSHGYYQLLRWIVCVAAIYVAYHGLVFKRPWAAWGFGFLAILFNPLAPINLDKSTWCVIDLAAAVAFVVGIVFVVERKGEKDSPDGETS